MALSKFSFGLKKLKGIVISIDQPYLTLPDFNFPGLIIKIFLIVALTFIFGPILLAIYFGILIASVMVSHLIPYNIGKSGCISRIFNHMLSFLFIKHMFGPKEKVTVLNVRLQDISGEEHLIRFKGEIVSGNFIVGDEIEVVGFIHNGTLIVREGWNNKIKSHIRIK